MSASSPDKSRKRRSGGESSTVNGDVPPVKKLKSGEKNIRSALAARCREIYEWIGDTPFSYLKKMMAPPPTIEIIDDEDIENQDVIPVLQLSPIVEKKLADMEKRKSSFLQGFDLSDDIPKPKNSSTPFLRDGTMVGYSLPSRNGYHSKNPKEGLRKSQKQRGSNNRCIAPLTNPGIDIEILLDSGESSNGDSEELEIVSEVYRRKQQRPSTYSRPAMCPNSALFNGASVASSGTSRRNGINGHDSALSTSMQGLKFGSTHTQLVRLKEKAQYEQLLTKLMTKASVYRPVEKKKDPVVQIDLTQDEDEVIGLPFKKEYLQKPVGDFMEKFYKPCQLVSKPSCSYVEQRNPFEAKEVVKEKTAVALPEYKRKMIKSKPDLFDPNWIKEFKTVIDEETKKRLQVVKQQEEKLKRYQERRDAKFEEEKLLFEKYKVPGDVFIEPAGYQVDDYPDFTTEMENVINSALEKGNETEEMCSMNGVTILRKHLATLDGDKWLIDEILNFYLNLIVERSKLDNYPTAYTYSTFFYSSLRTRGISAVLRWTRKVDIFSYDIVFIPLHLEVHWALCVIDNRSKTIRYYDSMGSGHTDCIIKPVHTYLIAEMKAKKNIIMDPDEYQLEVVKGLPKQMNGSDCGMFTLKYAEYISRDAPITFEQAHITYFRRRMVYEILTKQLL